MEAIYGYMLAAFPELFQTVPYYERPPEVGSGYAEAEVSGYTDVIIMAEKTFMATLGQRAFSAASSDALDYSDKEYLWAEADTPLRIGTFVFNVESNLMYRIVSKSEWIHTGGFIRFDFEIVQGATSEPDRSVAEPIKGSF